MKVFITADTHFRHRALADEYAARPADFEQTLTRHWHNDVGLDDLIIHLGDVVVGKLNEWASLVSSLPGRKVLVLGNHDQRSIPWYLKNGFDFCCSSFVWDTYGLKILFSHEPIFDGVFDLNIHGHLHTVGRHQEHQRDARHHLFSLEATAYRPRLLESIIKEWKKASKAAGNTA